MYILLPFLLIQNIQSFLNPPTFIRKTLVHLSNGSFENRLRKSMQENTKSFEELRMEKENEILDSGGDPFFLTDDFVFEKEPEEEDDDIPFNGGLSGLSGGLGSIIGSGFQGESGEFDEDLWNGEEDESAYFD
jgi:hypothetical protein